MSNMKCINSIEGPQKTWLTQTGDWKLIAEVVTMFEYSTMLKSGCKHMLVRAEFRALTCTDVGTSSLRAPSAVLPRSSAGLLGSALKQRAN